MGLPVLVDEGLVLQSMTTNRSDRSLTYNYSFDYETLNFSTFDLKAEKEAVLEECREFEYMLGNPVKKIIMVYKANDGTAATIEIFPQDCGF